MKRILFGAAAVRPCRACATCQGRPVVWHIVSYSRRGPFDDGRLGHLIRHYGLKTFARIAREPCAPAGRRPDRQRGDGRRSRRHSVDFARIPVGFGCNPAAHPGGAPIVASNLGWRVAIASGPASRSESGRGAPSSRARRSKSAARHRQQASRTRLALATVRPRRLRLGAQSC